MEDRNDSRYAGENPDWNLVARVGKGCTTLHSETQGWKRKVGELPPENEQLVGVG